jgi:hypothetical protein
MLGYTQIISTNCYVSSLIVIKKKQTVWLIQNNV